MDVRTLAPTLSPRRTRRQDYVWDLLGLFPGCRRSLDGPVPVRGTLYPVSSPGVWGINPTRCQGRPLPLRCGDVFTSCPYVSASTAVGTDSPLLTPVSRGDGVGVSDAREEERRGRRRIPRLGDLVPRTGSRLSRGSPSKVLRTRRGSLTYSTQV